MNLFNNLNQRYGQSYIKEVRNWEGKEQKLARQKCHLHFNLRFLSQNIVPKGDKTKHQTILNFSGGENHLQNSQVYLKQLG